jgi:hypothetical protein
VKSFSDAAMAEIVAGTALAGGAVEILSDPPVRVWTGYGTLPLTIAGTVTNFTGVGDHGLAQVSGSALGGSEQSVTLSLSNIDPALIALFDASEVKDAPTTLWRLIFKGDAKTLLDYHIYQRGRLDQIPVNEVVGGTATISALLETAARGLGRQGGRMRTDADQRLIAANDGFFKNVSYAGQKTLYWGGKPPSTAAGALPNSTVIGAIGGIGTTGMGRREVGRD